MKGWLFDTNVVSEWSKPKPDNRAVNALSKLPIRKCFVSVVTTLELQQGHALLPTSAKKTVIGKWLRQEYEHAFQSRILPMDERTLIEALKLAQRANAKRFNPGLADTLIAATAIVSGLVVVTRNGRDFLRFEIPLFNPWTGERFNDA